MKQYKGHVATRYYGWYALRSRGMREKAAPAATDGPPAIVPAPRLALIEATRRWALLQQIFEAARVSDLPWPHAGRRVHTQTSVIDRILVHLRGRSAREPHAGPRKPPHRHGPARAWARHAPHARPPTPRPPREYGPRPPARHTGAVAVAPTP